MYLSVFCRAKDYTAPVNFVSAGLRKTAAEEKQQQKQEAGSDDEGDDGDSDDGPSAPTPPRTGAPKKLQMVKKKKLHLCSLTISIYCSVPVLCHNSVYLSIL